MEQPRATSKEEKVTMPPIRTSTLMGIRNFEDLVESHKRKWEAAFDPEDLQGHSKRALQVETSPDSATAGSDLGDDDVSESASIFSTQSRPDQKDLDNKVETSNLHEQTHPKDHKPCPRCSKLGLHFHVPPKRIWGPQRAPTKVVKLPNKKIKQSSLIAMRQINEWVSKLETTLLHNDKCRIILDIREHIYRMEHFDFVDDQMLEASKVLSIKQGLPRLCSGRPIGETVISWDIQSDARALYQRWQAGHFDWSLLRGIQLRKSSSKSQAVAYRALEKNYELKVSCEHEGNGKLYNGQWWPYRICHIRDGAHGDTEAGIYGTETKGALAVVVADSRYCDIDKGNTLFYVSTEGRKREGDPDDQSVDETGDEICDEDEAKTKYTVYHKSRGARLLFRACSLSTKIRVIRSSKLPKSNKYRPKEGLRYDGLYIIEYDHALDLRKHIYRFKLVRVPGQDPIRYQDEMARPSKEEIKRLEEIEDLQIRAE